MKTSALLATALAAFALGQDDQEPMPFGWLAKPFAASCTAGPTCVISFQIKTTIKNEGTICVARREGTGTATLEDVPLTDCADPRVKFRFDRDEQDKFARLFVRNLDNGWEGSAPIPAQQFATDANGERYNGSTTVFVGSLRNFEQKA